MKKPDYSNFFYFNPLPSWVYDLEDLRIFDVNQAALDHYGYSQKEFLALTIKDLRPPEEVPKLIKALLNTKRVEGNIYIGIFTHKKRMVLLSKWKSTDTRLISTVVNVC